MLKMLVLAAALVVMTGPAFGQARLNCSSSERFGTNLIRVGNSERRVFQAAGQPDLERQLTTPQGGSAGIRLDYYRNQETIQIYIESGVVVRICRIRD